jgi:hypothetical protein
MRRNVMQTPSHRAFVFSLLSAIVSFSTAPADDHVILERMRSGMGMRSPARSTEIWLSNQALYINSGRLITIVRYDLQRRWTLSFQTKRFFEEPITPPEAEKKDSVTIHRLGWDYVPVYDWTVSEKQKEELICDQQCKLIVAEGDADYASESIEFWVTEKVPVNATRFNERVTATISDFDWAGILKAHASLKSQFIMKITDSKAHPIAPEMTYETKVTKIESAAPPPGIYEIPDGFQKVKSSDELTD